MTDNKYKYDSEKFSEWLSLSDFWSFGDNLIEFDTLVSKQKGIDSLAVAFDLQGFTSFCGQSNAYLVVGSFLKEFVIWLAESLMGAVKSPFFPENERVYLRYRLPYFQKFTGDGFIYLWDIEALGEGSCESVLFDMYCICKSYAKFLHRCKGMGAVPSVLRCGISRGEAFKIWKGEEYVGSCINVASRLSSNPDKPFAANAQGICVPDLNFASS